MNLKVDGVDVDVVDVNEILGLVIRTGSTCVDKTKKGRYQV